MGEIKKPNPGWAVCHCQEKLREMMNDTSIRDAEGRIPLALWALHMLFPWSGMPFPCFP